MTSLISVNQFGDKKQVYDFFSEVINASYFTERGFRSCKNKIMATVFYEPSTRTRFSFESAMIKMGGSVISETNFKNLSVTKGETLEDTIRVISNYADVIVLRHYLKGASQQAVKASSIPLINGGDGDGEHPTQALLDLYTISQNFKKIDGLKILFCGDLKHSRTTNSLLNLLSLFDVKVITTSPTQCILPYDGVRNLTLKNNWFETLKLALKEKPDVIYMTRLQKERIVNANMILSSCTNVEDSLNWSDYCLTPNLMKYLNKDAIIMHPLPRNAEIHDSIDSDPRAVYFSHQAKNGLKVRMGLLFSLFHGKVAWNE
jgi:aspartate carbamoyltransferase catalytic subunit